MRPARICWHTSRSPFSRCQACQDATAGQVVRKRGPRHNGHWCFVTVALERERFRALPRGAPNSGTCRAQGALLRDGRGERLVTGHWGWMRAGCAFFVASHEQRRAAVACACTACVFDCSDQLVPEASPAVCWLRPNGSRDKARSQIQQAKSPSPHVRLPARSSASRTSPFPPVRALMSTVNCQLFCPARCERAQTGQPPKLSWSG